MAELHVGPLECGCAVPRHEPRLVVLTGGPGAGKTAVLEMARRALCRHVAFLPEAAGIVFGGGFPRHASDAGRRGAQRAIYHVGREMERIVVGEAEVAVALCDRGTLDGVAYWPGPPEDYLRELGTTLAAEQARYQAVIHLRSPAAAGGYNHDNRLRIESAEEAARLDGLILEAWRGHPRRFLVDNAPDFLTKAARALDLIRGELPPCCLVHRLAAG